MKRLDAPIELYQFDNLSTLNGITHFVSAANVSLSLPDGLTNRRAIAQHLGFSELIFTLASQVHGTDVRIVDNMLRGCGAFSDSSRIANADAMFTADANICLTILTADCVPILIADARNRVVATVHAGWRGTVGGVAAATVEAMVEQFASKPSDMFVGIGPCIGPCCFEVGDDVARQIGLQFVRSYSHTHRPMVDLRAANVAQLEAAGIPTVNIEVSDICTCCSSFPSHRRNKTQARIGTGILIRKT